MRAGMKAWVYRKDRKDSFGIHLYEEELPIPEPGQNQVLIRVEKVSVCGTDESLFRGELKRVPDGIVPGHEFYGRIEQLGKSVSGLNVGQKIAGESHYQVPGALDPGIIGVWGPELTKGQSLPPLNGAYAEYLCIPAECAHPVPENSISKNFWPSLFEAIGNDYFLIQRVRQIPKLNYLGVFGSGPHGLFAQIFAKHFQIGHIAAFETDAFRRQFASELMAADQVFDPSKDLIENAREFTHGNLFDVTLDMVGKKGQGFQACCETTRDGGTIFLFGLFTERFSIEGTPGNEIIFKTQSVQHQYQGKKLKIIGVTGREGIWNELIQTVSENQPLQEHLMRPVRVMGNLDALGNDTRHPQPGILKRAYHGFNSDSSNT